MRTWKISLSVGESIPAEEMDAFIKDIEEKQQDDVAAKLRDPNHKQFIKYIDNTKK